MIDTISVDQFPCEYLEIHFDVPQKMLSAKTLSNVANGLQAMADVVFFDSLSGGDAAEVFLIVPKDGCYQAIFTIVCSALPAGALFFQGFTNQFVKRILGKDLNEVGVLVADKTVDLIDKNNKINKIIEAMTKYLSTETEELEKEVDVEGCEEEFLKLQRGKNDIYESIKDDERVKRISYDGEKYISRNDFGLFYGEVEEEDGSLVNVGYYQGKIKILSPVSLREKSKRKWSCVFISSEMNVGEVVFGIDDEDFKYLAIKNHMKLATDDIADVQMIHNNHLSPKWRVIKVIEYVGKKISDPLTKEELIALSIEFVKPNRQKQANLLNIESVL
nr:hypothetical protein [Pseudodesulfovibrio sp.]